MHPAPSIIAFTVMSGLGYGLAAVLCLGLLDPNTLATGIAWLVALALIGAGLLCSTFHLGNPQRAWRAFSQWRSSWLSREGVSAVVTFALLVWSAWLCLFEGQISPVAMVLGFAGCIATVFCTSMIYAQLKSVDAWHTPLTSASFMLFSLAGGLTSAAFFDALGAGSRTGVLALGAVVALIAAWVAKLKWRARLGNPSTSTTASATRLGPPGSVRLFEPPHMTSNYLTREMMFRIGRKHAVRLFRLSVILGCVAPVLFLLLGAAAAGLVQALLLLAATCCHVAGILLERWLFFAEARHAVSAYYGS